jgi:hypothetical protein
MNAAMNGRPSVVFPSVRTVMRGLAASSLVKYSTTCFHDGSFRSAPGSNPSTDAGVGIFVAAGACARGLACAASGAAMSTSAAME